MLLTGYIHLSRRMYISDAMDIYTHHAEYIYPVVEIFIDLSCCFYRHMPLREWRILLYLSETDTLLRIMNRK